MHPSVPSQIIHDVGRRVAEIRALRGLTQEKLAVQADVTLKYIQRIEAGKENLTLESLVHLSNLLCVDIVEFFVKPVTVSGKRGRPPRKKQNPS